MKMLTVREAADFLRCCEHTIRQRVSEGEIEAYQSGIRILIPEEALQKHLEQNPYKAAGKKRCENRKIPTGKAKKGAKGRSKRTRRAS